MNILFQCGVGDHQDILACSARRMETMRALFPHVYLQYYYQIKPEVATVTPFWEKWKRLRDLMTCQQFEIIVAADADVLWVKPENIFEALPANEEIGVTHLWGCVPSAGCVWIRNSERMRAFVDSVIAKEEEFQHLVGHDQSAMLATAKEMGITIARLAPKWHVLYPNEGVLQGFHLMSDRLNLMKARLAEIEQSENRDERPNRVGEPTLAAQTYAQLLQFHI